MGRQDPVTMAINTVGLHLPPSKGTPLCLSTALEMDYLITLIQLLSFNWQPTSRPSISLFLKLDLGLCPGLQNLGLSTRSFMLVTALALLSGTA